jgi:hypothetical protein
MKNAQNLMRFGMKSGSTGNLIFSVCIWG